MIQPVDISAESLKWISKSIGASNEDILSKGQKLRIESSQRTFFRIPFKDKSYEYWTKTTTEGNYSIKLRKKIGENNIEEIWNGDK